MFFESFGKIMSHAQSILDLTQAITYCGLYTLTCFSFGVSILRLLQISPIQGMALSGAGYLGGAFFVGQGLFGAIWQTVAVLGYFSMRVVLTILTITLLTGAIYLPSIFKATINRFCVVIKETKTLGVFWVLLILSLIALIALFAFLTLYPSGTDAIAYYLAQAKLIAATGKLYRLPGFECFSLFGLNAEMHAATQYLLCGDVAGEYAAKMCVWLTALAGAAILWAISSRVGLGRRGQWMVTIMLYTTTGFTLVIWDGKTDLFGACLGLAAVYWVLQIGKIKDWIALFLSGLMIGFAVNSKFSLLLVMMPLLTILAGWCLWTDTSQDYSQKDRSVNKQKWQRLFLGSLIAVGATIIPFLALFFKNGILYGEPLAPFSILNSHLVSAVLDQSWYTRENTRWIILTYPLALTFGQYPMQHGNITPLLLAFLPFLFFFSKNLSPFRNQRLMVLTLSSVVGILFWVIFRPSVFAPRYILSPLLTLLPLGGYIVEQLWKSRENLVLRLSTLVVAFFMIVGTIITYRICLPLAKSFWIASSRAYRDPVRDTLRFVNANANRGDIVYMAMTYRLYLRPDLLQCLSRKPQKEKRGVSLNRKWDLSSNKKWGLSLNRNMWEDLYHQGVTWLVLDRSIPLGHVFGVIKKPNPFLKSDYLSIITYPIDRNFMVYQIIPKAGAPKPQQRCIEQKDGTWLIKNQH